MISRKKKTINVFYADLLEELERKYSSMRIMEVCVFS